MSTFNRLDALLDDSSKVISFLENAFFSELGQEYVSAALSRKDVQDELPNILIVPQDIPFLMQAAADNNLDLTLTGCTVVKVERRGHE
jgi:hypothetical protein